MKINEKEKFVENIEMNIKKKENNTKKSDAFHFFVR